MNWATIWEAIHGLVSGLSDKNKWKMSVDGVAGGPISAVKAGATGLKFTFEDGGDEMTLEAVTGNPDHAVVKVNGHVDDKARLVFSMKHQFLKPLIVVFEFKNVTVNGATKRYRFDNPK